MSNKQAFVLYHDIRAPLELLDDAERGRLFTAILDYSEFGIMPDFSGSLQMAFAFIRTALDRDAEKWERKSEARAEAGRRGGIKSGERRREASKANASETNQTKQNEANEAIPVPAPVLTPVPVPENKIGRAARFSPPSVEEVAAYCQERHSSVDPQQFVDFYAAKGWKVGSQPMKDWQAAVRTWERRQRNDGRNISDGHQNQAIPNVTRL